VHSSFELPGEFVRTEARGLDSQVAEDVTPTASVSQDYGAYSNSLVELRDMKMEQSCLITTHETPVRFVTGRREAHFVVAAHWPNLDDSAVGRVSLKLYGVAQDAIAARTLHGVLRSVRVDAVAWRAPPP
jgi:hypothetical protein